MQGKQKYHLRWIGIGSSGGVRHNGDDFDNDRKMMVMKTVTVITGTFQCYGEPSRSRGIPEHPLSALEPKQ